ncbi:hypothetical protein FKW77_004048 [Venturia effusa]|uniref:Uncharacterized protein n=1 Tax=Venturia effusa TaxID=50376 RepID=A0A517LPZ0_9PEZI|nr:hypothetical protein FKW77_004048 [Venturia effusa]
MALFDSPCQRCEKRPRSNTDISDADADAHFLALTFRAPKPDPKSAQLFDIFTKRAENWTIFNNVASRLPASDVFSLQRVCKATAPIYKELQRTGWNVDKRLGRFFRDPVLFRWTLGINDALVSGSFALQFFERVMWKESDLDIFVQEGAGFDNMCSHLIEKEGYALQSHQAQEQLRHYHVDLLVEIKTFVRSPSDTDLYRKVQVISTSSIPIKSIICGFYTTALLNFITWNKAYSIFPVPTFRHYKTYPLVRIDEYHETLFTKMHNRGWKTQPLRIDKKTDDRPDPCPGFISSKAPGHRRIGDSRSWKMDLPIEGMAYPKPTMPDSVLEYSEMTIRYGRDRYSQFDTLVSFYAITAPTFESPVLKYAYTYGAFMLELSGRLTDLTRCELSKLPAEKRPERRTTDIRRDYLDWVPSTWTPPSSWTYYDEDLPAWYEAEQSRCEAQRK